MISVKVVALGTVVTVEVPEGANLSDVAAAARVDNASSLNAQLRGNTVGPEAHGTTTVAAGDTVIFTPPALKHG